jgi:putative ABC transport system ATP-binding protein
LKGKTMMSLIVIENIVKIYGEGDAAVRALDGINLTINRGEFLALMGESGAGKSTLLSIMGAMNTPTSGRYLVDNIDIYDLQMEQQADFRREYLGFVFQSFHLVPYLTVKENIMLPLTGKRMPKSEKETMAMEALEWVGLTTKAQRLPNEISGGESERVAVARAIVNNPPILLADEPTGNLDSRNTQDVMALLQRLHADGTTIVMVTHSTACSVHAQRTLVVADGRLGTAINQRENSLQSQRVAEKEAIGMTDRFLN